MVSRAVGASNFGRAVEIARQSLIFGVAVAVIITAATVFYCREIVALAGMPVEIRAVAEEFFASLPSPWGRITFSSSPTPLFAQPVM